MLPLWGASFWRVPEGGCVAEAEIIARRRKWSAEQKAALLSEVEAEGGRVATVARRHGLSESLLYNWRSAWQAGSSARAPDAMQFVPLGVFEGPGEKPALLAAPDHRPDVREPPAARVDHIEIELPNGVRVRVAGSVNEKALSRVFRALKGAG